MIPRLPTSLFAFPSPGGSSTLVDAVAEFVDDGDPTKILQFEVSGITTGTTRTVTVPDANGTMALTSDLVWGTDTNIDALLAPTWADDAGTTYIAQKINVTAAGSYAAASRLASWQLGGTEKVGISAAGVLAMGLGTITQSGSQFDIVPGGGGLRVYNDGVAVLASDGRFFLGSALDVRLCRDAAGILAQRNGTNAQTLRISRTWTSSSDYEWLALQSGSGYFEIAAESAGTGTANMDLRLTPKGTGVVWSAAKIVSTWQGNSGVPALCPNVDDLTTGFTASSGTIYVCSTGVSAARLGSPSWGIASFGSGTGRGLFSGIERSTNPSAPAEGYWKLWMSDGTGHGDDGDILIVSTAGGVTNYSIIHDHSAGTTF